MDPESRHIHKSNSNYRDGYKAHVAVEPDTGIITACTLTPANTPDGSTGVGLLDGDHVAVIKPWPLAHNRRLGDDQFVRDDFAIDYDSRTVTCPNDHTVPISNSGRASLGSRCEGCPVRDRCTPSTRGKIYRVGEHDQLLAKARADWRDGIGADNYRQHRPMVERSIAWLVTNDGRRVRYRGVAANQTGLAHRAATINLKRLVNLGIDHNNDTWNPRAA